MKGEMGQGVNCERWVDGNNLTPLCDLVTSDISSSTNTYATTKKKRKEKTSGFVGDGCVWAPLATSLQKV